MALEDIKALPVADLALPDATSGCGSATRRCATGKTLPKHGVHRPVAADLGEVPARAGEERRCIETGPRETA
jgi:hypothetical protein